MIIRHATIEDCPAIRDLYNHEVLTGTGTFDIETRSLPEQQAWLLERSSAYVVLVALDTDDEGDTEADGEFLGFAALSAYKDRAAYKTTVENSVYVHPDHRGRGVGKALLSGVVEHASRHGFHNVIARIGGGNDNPGSVATHRSAGFELVGVEREVGRKFGRWVDVVTMQRLL